MNIRKGIKKSNLKEGKKSKSKTQYTPGRARFNECRTCGDMFIMRYNGIDICRKCEEDETILSSSQ